MGSSNQLITPDDIKTEEDFTDANRINVRYGDSKGAHYKIASLIHNQAITSATFEFLDINYQYMPQNPSTVTNNFDFNEYKVAQEHLKSRVFRAFSLLHLALIRTNLHK